MKIFLIIAVALQTSFALAKDPKRQPQSGESVEYSCTEYGGGSRTLLLRVPSDMNEGQKYQNIVIQIKNGNQVLFDTNRGTASTEDVHLFLSAKNGNKKLSGTLFMDELDQTSITLKNGKKSRQSFRFDCGSEE